MATDPVFGEVISSYSRHQAIADGVLVDLMQGEPGKMAGSLGFRMSIAMTAAAYERAISPSDGVLPPGQDLNGRLWDVLWMLRLAIKTIASKSDTVRFQLSVSNLEAGRIKTELLALKGLCGPGDEGEPTITILLPDED